MLSRGLNGATDTPDIAWSDPNNKWWLQDGHDDIAKSSRPSVPIDLWGKFDPPPLPGGLVPPLIERFAAVQGGMMGADPSGLAMAALAVCAASITDEIQIRVKQHDARWSESARIWVALVGTPSTKKTPIINEAAYPLKRIDNQLARIYAGALSKHLALPTDERKQAEPPEQKRMRIEDTTVEAMQEVLKDNPEGVLCLQDELGGWFGAMDRYASGKGASRDRSIWLQAFNGGPYAVNRIQRGAFVVPNLSVCLLGGIQPEPIQRIAAETSDDGLLQRLFPIVLASATAGKDEPMPPVTEEYARLIQRLHDLRPQDIGYFGPGATGDGLLKFDDDAQDIRRSLERQHMEWQAIEVINPKLAAHIGKYDGLFARLCLLFHIVGNIDHEPITNLISGNVAARVAKFMHEFLLPHAISFFAGILGLSSEQENLSNIASYILAHGLTEVTFRDIQRGDRAMRGLDRLETTRIMEHLESLGWLESTPGPRPTSPNRWIVNSECHRLYSERASSEHARREGAKAIIKSLAERNQPADG